MADTQPKKEIQTESKVIVPVEPKKQQMNPLDPRVQELSKEANNLGRRLRVLEDRYSNLRRKVQLTDTSVLTHQKRIYGEIKTIENEMQELKKQIIEIKSQALLILKEFNLLAKKNELNVIKKYIELWQPLDFLTRRDAELIIKRTVDEYKNKKL